MTDKETRSGEAAILQKQAEEALRESNDRLSLATRAGGVGIWDLDLVQNILIWDDQMFALYGVTRDHFGGAYESWKTAVLPEDVQQADAEVQLAWRGEKDLDTEFRVLWPNGAIHNIRVLAIVKRDAYGQPVRMIGTNWDTTAQKQADEALKQAHDELEQRVAERTEELQQANEDLWTEITDRKQAEELTQRERAFFDQLVETAREGIAINDPQGKVMRVNAEFVRMFGYGANEAVGQCIDDLVVPPARQEEARAITRSAGQGEESLLETVRCRKDGTLVDVSLISAPILVAGKQEAVYAIYRDITDRKQAEEALRESEENFRHFLDDSPLGVRIVTAEGETIYANRAILDIYGFSSLEELRTTPLEKRYTSESYIEFKKRYERRQQGEDSPSEYEVNVVRKNGEVRHLLVSRKGQLWNGKKQYQLLYRDITKSKQAEETLYNERLLLRTLIDNIPDSIYSKDLACRKTLVNSAEVRYIGAKSEADLLGKSDFDIYPGELAEKFFADDQLVMQTGEPMLNREEYVLDEKQQKRWLLTSKLPLRNQEGRIIGLVGIGRDITDRKQAEESREQTEAQLRQSQKMEAIGTLAGGVAHDFNNLLTGILGNIALMRGSLPPADPLLENLNAAETSARQAADLTKGLLTFSRSAMVLPVPINITAALDATLALLKQSLPATIDIVRDYEQTTWNVLVDQSQMTQILLNLAVNARDAMDGKGALTIRARNEVVGEEYLQTHPFARTGEFIHLSVTDTGPGMSSEVMEHLFEPFYTTKPIGSGTGLGLSVVYGAVKQAGGWITAVSTEGVGRTAPQKYPSDWKNILGGIGQTCSGATFDIYLPRCLQEPAQSFAPASIPVNAGSGTVLVVEDEPIVCAVTQALLSRSGYTVLTALDGASALNVLRDHPVGIGLILLDMTMPGMTTGEVVQAIRALDPTVPILLNSGYTSNGAVKQMLEENSVQGFLGKPYDLDQLLGKVQMLLHRG
ncbi:PAS domain S-box protein [Candidatus Cryosericum septentrionale]|jgi:two-component system cell cycle sensor histidine kinase/response regulator CckA|uniref:histidine kinase n=1 Tax=Candidatus Cryosericum septentrionale TaxID=2290913 RepID=A0A398DYI3_9BACT|nr:PAS domain S-box protein [Candidatus Cryosericum septentrionale]RIE17238.1 PAS domain S-box protein [Candidatus Cryosericum septentrionale]